MPRRWIVVTHLRANLSFSEWASVFGDAKMTTVHLGRLTLPWHIPESGYVSFRVKANAAAAPQKGGEKPSLRHRSQNPWHVRYFLHDRARNQ
ncbi:ATP-binding protein [Martelella alba]|uniref:ATP-binding protein n=1 Tax=Martelella alba TaxID=2590451 RepID=UPI0038B341E4